MQHTDIKKKNTSNKVLHQFPRAHLVAASALIASLTMLLTLFPTEEVAAKRHNQTLDIQLPETLTSAPEELNVPAVEENIAPAWTELKVKSGDSLSLIFQRAGLNDRDVYELMHHCREAKTLKRIHPGHTLAFQIDDQGNLQQLRYTENKLKSQLFTRISNEQSTRFNAKTELRQPDTQIAYREATIHSSLFMAGQQANMEAGLIMELANIFGWDIDFALDIRQGDSFSILYEEQFLDGEKLGNGAILAAEFTNQGKSYKAVRYTDTNGISHFYTPDGNTMRKEFLRTPIEFARISSHFNLNRKHPVLNRIRAHKGTDYAAPRGTPIRAAGDGKVIFAGRKGGYGNTVIIQHGQTYKTLYAHLNKFRRGVRSGSRVKQGQTIGYVGSTGLATGPHLHYEFYVNGAVRNPVTVKLPKANAIAKKERARFMTQTQSMLAQLDHYQQTTQLAMVDNSSRDQAPTIN